MPTSTALRHDRRFVFLVSARTVSVLGNGFGRIALAFAVLDLPHGSAGRLSLVLAAQVLPQIVFVLVGGVISDRLSRYRLMVGAELLAGSAWLALAIMVLSRHAPLAAMLAAAAVSGSASALFVPASSGVVPEFVAPADLQSANASIRMGQNIALVSGLALSGIVVAATGAGWALAIDAASFLISAVLLSTLRLPARERAPSASTWTELRLGWREFVARQWLWAVVVQFSVLVAAIGATNGVFGPQLAVRDFGGARPWAFLLGLQALGSVAGAGFARRLRVQRPILVAVLATTTFALPMFTLGFGFPLWISGIAMFCTGVATDIFGVLWGTTMQREIPEAVLSRVSAYDILGSICLAPLGIVVAGPVAQAVGTKPALIGCGVLALATAGAALLSPDVRTLRTPGS